MTPEQRNNGRPLKIRLRCVRCGDWHEREPGDPYLPWLCSSCFSKGLSHLFAEGVPQEECDRRYARWLRRWWKNVEGHPTDKALNKAYAAWQAEAG